MHAFISFKTKNFKDAISYLESKQISNIRLVEHNLNSMETMIEADVPNGVGLSSEYMMQCQYGSTIQLSDRISLTGMTVESSVRNQYRFPS